MASYIYNPPAMPDTKKEECACPTCGGLECLCRPRFFAGQLLTDETLNRLEHYIVEKNKLHNRYLHGWGVVCGLEVVCSSCNVVTVRSGYALSPCGEDIIVCRNVPVDVCGLINQCRDKRRDWECEPYATGQNPDCRDVEEEWILAVRYDETSSRGITALKGGSASSCGSGCGCGGSSACGCGCHGQNGNGGGSQRSAYATAATGSSVKQSYRPASATVAAQCEPTLTCEGYVFEVYKAPPDRTELKSSSVFSSQDHGALINRAQACLENFVVTLQPMPQNATRAALHEWCCNLKVALQNYLFDYPGYDCQTSQASVNLTCPDPSQFPAGTAGDAAYRQAIEDNVVHNVSIVGLEFIRYCICSSFLPPCPEVVCDPRVPLATVTVRKDNNGICRIVRICNLGKRKYVTTFVSLGYWLSFLKPLLTRFRAMLEKICCKPFRFATGLPLANLSAINARKTVVKTTTGDAAADDDDQPSNAAPPVNAPMASAPTAKLNERGFKAFMSRLWANRTRTIDAQTLFLGAIGARDANGTPYLAATELKNPFYTLMLNNLARPLLAKLPDETPDTLNSMRTTFAGNRAGDSQATTAAPRFSKTTDKRAARPGVDEEISNLNTRVSELQATVERQSEIINELRDRLQKDK